MKKFILLLVSFLIINITSLSAYFISDNSYIVKFGSPVLGTFVEDITGSSGESEIESAIEPFSSYNLTVEMHTRLELFNNTFLGAGFSYIPASGTVDTRTLTPSDSSSALVTEQNIGIDYIPIYLMLQYKFDSTFYPDEDMFLNFKLGLSIERISDEWKEAATDLGIENIAEAPSPFISLGLGFEYNSFIFEIDYQYTASAAANLSDSTQNWVSYTNRINLNIGYRFNIGGALGGSGSYYDEELYDPIGEYDEF